MLDLDEATRGALWAQFLTHERERRDALRERAVANSADDAEIGVGPHDPGVVLERVMRALDEGIVPTDHPRYFGLFNSATTALGVLADAIASAWNPQLATRGHASWPVGAEERTLAALGERFGFARDAVRGAFTSGGGEANVTALLCAVATRFPEWATRGVRSLGATPRVYVSAEGHATIARAARIAGLGAECVREIPADADLRMKTSALAEALARDKREGDVPFFIVATAGTTSAGAIDPIPEIATLAERHGAWVHVDAAWGGLAALVPEQAHLLAGVERADSITFDPHKAMGAPMGTGTFLTRHDGALERVFSDATGYMPRDGARDPYGRSFQWSRRFVGLRIVLPLAVLGWEAHTRALRRQFALADRLRAALRASGWTLVAETPLPIVCFVDHARRDAKFLDAVARRVIATAGGWISVPRLANGGRVLRACINNHRTEERDIDRLVDALAAARAEVRA